MSRCPVRSVEYVIWSLYERRAESLAAHLNVTAVFMGPLVPRECRFRSFLLLIDYFVRAVHTLVYLVKSRPEVVIAQSPPSFCSMVCQLYCRATGALLVVDAHNGAFEFPWIRTPLYERTLRKAALVLVHNPVFEDYLRRRYDGIPFLALRDSLPILSEEGEAEPRAPYLLAIASYSPDEPLDSLLAAMERFTNTHPDTVTFCVTGNYREKMELYRRFKNVKGIEFLGYVDILKYDRMLNNARGVIALTTQEMVQQCASVEALAAGIPMIVSDTTTNRRLFTRGVVFCRPDEKAIFRAIEELVTMHTTLKKDIREMRQAWQQAWEREFHELQSKLRLK